MPQHYYLLDTPVLIIRNPKSQSAKAWANATIISEKGKKTLVSSSIFNPSSSFKLSFSLTFLASITFVFNDMHLMYSLDF